MTSQPGQRRITTHYFFKNYAKNEAGKLVPDRFSFFNEALY